MSDYKFDCPHCGQSLEAPEDMLDETIDCPSCGGKLELPKPEPAPPPRPRPQPPRPQHTQQRTQQRQTVETNVKQGALIGGVVCFVLGVIMMCVSLWTVIVYAPLFLAAFVLSIVAMAQKRIAGGVILLVLTVAVPPVLMIAVPSFKTARSAAQEAAQARAAVAATVEKEPEVARTATVREPSEPEPEPEPKPQAKPALPTDPVYRFNSASLPSLPEGEEARLMVVPAYHYNDVWETLGDRELRITFGGEKFYVYVERDGFILTRSAVQELVSLMEKYRDWKTKALAMGTTVQKDIGTLSVEIFWKTYDDEWHWGKTPVTAACSFFSQNKQRHQMTMQFEKVASTQNEYIDHRLETIYFDSEGVNAFLEAFSRSNIDKKVAEHKRQKQLESQFQ